MALESSSAVSFILPVDHLYSETLLGHSTGLVGVYTRVTEEDLLKEYLKALLALTINEDLNKKYLN
jgi:hypothetical protein